MPVSTDTVLQAMNSLQQKNLVVPGYSETKTTKTDFKHNAIIKRAKKKKYYELTAQAKEILDEKPKEPPNESKHDDYLPKQSDDVLLEHLRDPGYQEKQSVILILENRGYRVSIKDNKVKLYRKSS